MATKAGTLSREPFYATAEWDALAAGDVGSPVNMADFPHKTVQAIGDATSVALQGSNDGTTWTALNDSAGTAIALTTGTFAVVLEAPLYIRPSATGGTSTKVIVVGTRQ